MELEVSLTPYEKNYLGKKRSVAERYLPFLAVKESILA
jgi:hypothetical protein